ncbi:MAG: TetR/AcrR family transcriptional regulator [Clostridiales Family XIII bacterium]|jgi:AcrR family transcriptional regulator|nr:TetR/AcrR family transcriptional regulator [Clostridiales Family XIII bacterium]
MKKKATARVMQAKKTKNKIFQSAIKLIEKRGFDNTTIEDISKLAGVSVGAFYHHYKSKREIFLELYKEIDSYYENEVAPQATSPDVSDNLLLFLRHYARYNVLRGYDNVKLLFQGQDKLLLDRERYMYVLLRQILTDGLDRRQFAAGYDAAYIEDYLLVMTRGVVYDWLLKEGAFDLEEKLAEYFGLFFQIFRAKP